MAKSKGFHAVRRYHFTHSIYWIIVYLC